METLGYLAMSALVGYIVYRVMATKDKNKTSDGGKPKPGGEKK